jgi:hypothetical protein
VSGSYGKSSLPDTPPSPSPTGMDWACSASEATCRLNSSNSFSYQTVLRKGCACCIIGSARPSSTGSPNSGTCGGACSRSKPAAVGSSRTCLPKRPLSYEGLVAALRPDVRPLASEPTEHFLTKALRHVREMARVPRRKASTLGIVRVIQQRLRPTVDVEVGMIDRGAATLPRRVLLAAGPRFRLERP